MPENPHSKQHFSLFSRRDTANYSRMGKTIRIQGMDGTNQESDSVEANLLYDILNVLKAKK